MAARWVATGWLGIVTAPPPVFLTVDGIAKRLNVHPNTVYRLVRTGDLRAYRIGRSLRVNRDDLLAYIRDAEVGK